MLTIDTNILIAYIGGEEVIVNRIKEWREKGVILFVSSITECELLSYPRLSQEEEGTIERLIREHFTTVPFDSVRARKAAAIRRMLPSLKLPDAAIGALALETKTALVTRNIRDFKKIPSLEVVRL